MSLFTRVASMATISAFGLAMLGMTTPGFAQQVAHPQVTTLNALTLPQVPLQETIQPAQDEAAPAIQPAISAMRDESPVAVAENDADEEFASLHDAVAAQSVAANGDRELQCLASGVFHESHGESLAGQLAVAQTIVNRAESGRFPKSICSVLTQRGQFSFVRGGVVPMPTSRRGWDTAVAVAKVAYRDLWDDVAPKALFFHARHVSPGWRLARVAAIGNHVFYR